MRPGLTQSPETKDLRAYTVHTSERRCRNVDRTHVPDPVQRTKDAKAKKLWSLPSSLWLLREKLIIQLNIEYAPGLAGRVCM